MTNLERWFLWSIFFIAVFSISILLFASYAGCSRKKETAAPPTATGESVIVGPGQTGIATKTGIVVRPSIPAK